ncbi:hypothetical protein ACHHYP_17310 [Achlya hypogyna]|uniref:Nucleotide-diphospho-sugar transferase domain-containing protein n=1 Tax=Achlya hypogyna TaxID=1202772 RepID=A0A1V9ZDF5_ACHHY|nr:hypothetical protein ACHHYP_17310 [Achlya hypogyna]
MAATRTETLVDVATAGEVRGYRKLLALYQSHFGIAEASREDKKLVTQVQRLLAAADAALTRTCVGANVAVFTAYTSDYSVGEACAHINKIYAERHGYEFYVDVLPYDEMLAAIAPRQFCGWYKVAMLRRFLADMDALRARGIGYLMWIDADAVVIDHSRPAQELIAVAEHRDLIISEDINPCCLVNTGVLLVKVSDWSRALWEEVWTMRKYFDVFFYEQSALLRCLKKRDEGLVDVRPFHSFVPGGPSGLKLFPHVAVTPHLELNSNRCNGLTVHISDATKRIDTSYSADENGEMAKYIFHCAGRCDKALTLTAVLQANGFDTSDLRLSQLKLVRSKGAQ